MPTATADKPTDRLLTVDQVCELTSLSRSAVYALMDAHKLPHIRIPGTGTKCIRRVAASVLNEFIRSHSVGTT